MTAPAPVLIAGGGISGLAAAIALARRGIAARVLERRTQFAETGAGIQLGPNGVRALRRLGVDGLLAPSVGVPERIAVFDGATGVVLARLPLGDWIARRHGAPYWVAHRADLHAALLMHARNQDGIELTAGFDVARAENTDAGVRAHGQGGEAIEGAALLAADGQFSRLRAELFAAPPLRFSGKTASRTVVDAALAGGLAEKNATGVWLAPKAHVVHYPVRGGREIAVVAIIDQDWREEEWAALADRGILMSALQHFSPELLRLLDKAPEWRRWALFDAEPMASWMHGRVALLGDAAHPILPFLAQGGSMALEDAVTLADCLHDAGTDIETAFLAYQTARAGRTGRVIRASRRNGRIYHLSGLAAAARNAMLRGLPGARIMAGYDWLYGQHHTS